MSDSKPLHGPDDLNVAGLLRQAVAELNLCDHPPRHPVWLVDEMSRAADRIDREDIERASGTFATEHGPSGRWAALANLARSVDDLKARVDELEQSRNAYAGAGEFAELRGRVRYHLDNAHGAPLGGGFPSPGPRPVVRPGIDYPRSAEELAPPVLRSRRRRRPWFVR